MALSAFDDPAAPPERRDLARRLGDAAPLWATVLASLHEAFDPLAEVWTFAGAKYGWSLRVKLEERVLLYLTPAEGRFLAGIVLGEKAAAAAHGIDLPAFVVALVDAAPRYAEGRGIRLPIGPGDDVEPIRRLVALKLAPGPPRPRARRDARASRPRPRG
jgi:hypothetical protein